MANESNQFDYRWKAHFSKQLETLSSQMGEVRGDIAGMKSQIRDGMEKVEAHEKISQRVTKAFWILVGLGAGGVISPHWSALLKALESLGR